jgi:hypothetical protein
MIATHAIGSHSARDEQLGRFQRHPVFVYGKLGGLGFAKPIEKRVE